MKWKTRKFRSWQLYFLIFILVELTFGNFGEILCIGEDGHVKIESTCQPCCGEPDDFCSTIGIDINHDHHDNCDNCSDLQLDGRTWHRKHTAPLFAAIHFSLLPTFSIDHTFLKTDSKYSLLFDRYSCFGRNQVSTSISTTVILC